ncbi:hypothetical protein ACU635_43800 [[Actinomadura] parvosata]|uniref:hypothetical protein n=1 Tax=[Actinomadura] parvosata TaxID=1955412 RepID=UPI00406C5AE9
MELIQRAGELFWAAMTVLGTVVFVVAIGGFVWAWKSHRADQREQQRRRDERARAQTPDAVLGKEGLRVWMDFVRDQKLHTISAPKERP